VLVVLSFRQELIKELVGAAATAVLVTGIATFAITWWSRRRDERQARFELRNDLLKRSSRLAQEMYTKCQHTRRILRDGTEHDQHEALYFLDGAYLEFAAAAQTLEFELGARFGFTQPDSPMTRDVAIGVWEGWHQIRDLLTVYYFNLKDDYRGDVLETNSRDDSGFHSGIDLVPLGSKASEMRKTIRRTYDPALRGLVERILSDTIVTQRR
jgi:hypothetical protein